MIFKTEFITKYNHYIIKTIIYLTNNNNDKNKNTIINLII